MAGSTISTQWTHLIRFEDEHGNVRYGQPILSGSQLTVADVSGGQLKAYLIEGDVFGTHRVTSTVLSVKKVLAPILPPFYRGIGLNYRRHAEITKAKTPQNPIVFIKPPRTTAGPLDPIIIPTICQDGQTDYEAELAVVIGKPCKDVSKEEALNYVAGYTACNDVSARKWQTQLCGGQWCFGKGFDSFNPIGPMIVSSKVMTDPNNVRLGTKINGKVLQDWNTSDMIFDVASIVSFLSQGSTLMPGEIICTGTPHGVGSILSPQVWLKDKDVCEIFVDGIGSLVNPVVHAKGTIKL
ncbi:fumarylacetoacetate hydrolase family protein [Zychaea mexicana]|uniref:fumarylacetoacetate hydrolase family protein n=1 Tax=Zychaea mexicana TaxID=64656 RepID=UPI0022FDFE5F|nr:fumarylacetoacetate hydrolase family protein [Zychaea mexicana]KAI9488570.1 fumarylacetoacetate hydrolase family protein [Zychaea mexicana]